MYGGESPDGVCPASARPEPLTEDPVDTQLAFTFGRGRASVAPPKSHLRPVRVPAVWCLRSGRSVTACMVTRKRPQAPRQDATSIGASASLSRHGVDVPTDNHPVDAIADVALCIMGAGSSEC